jgi:hypothetical protein
MRFDRAFTPQPFRQPSYPTIESNAQSFTVSLPLKIDTHMLRAVPISWPVTHLQSRLAQWLPQSLRKVLGTGNSSNVHS